MMTGITWDNGNHELLICRNTSTEEEKKEEGYGFRHYKKSGSKEYSFYKDGKRNGVGKKVWGDGRIYSG